MGACKSAVEWIGDKTKEQAWNECERGDWLWWYLRIKELVTKEQSVMFAKFCAERAAGWAAGAALAAEAAERAAEVAERAALAAELAAEWAAEAAERAALAAEAAGWAAGWDAEAAERKKQADFIRSIIKFEDLKERL